MLVLHGEDDDLVPCFQAELLYEASAAPPARKTLVRLPAVGPNGLPHRPEYWPALTAFVDSALEARPR